MIYKTLEKQYHYTNSSEFKKNIKIQLLTGYFYCKYLCNRWHYCIAGYDKNV